MASFTAQAGLADINNSAALTRALMTAPTRNPFTDIKLPSSMQSENSTENALNKLKMRTESVRADSIVAGDKLAIQKLNVLKTKNAFDREMSNKEFGLKDALQTFTINDTATKTAADVAFNTARTADIAADNTREDYRFAVDANQSGLDHALAVEKAADDKKLNEAKILEAKANRLAREAKEAREAGDHAKALKAEEDAVTISKILDNQATTISMHDKTEVKDVTTSVFTDANAVQTVQDKIAELAKNPKLNKEDVNEDVKVLLDKIEEIRADKTIPVEERELEILKLSKKVKYKNTNINVDDIRQKIEATKNDKTLSAPARNKKILELQKKINTKQTVPVYSPAPDNFHPRKDRKAYEQKLNEHVKKWYNGSTNSFDYLKDKIFGTPFTDEQKLQKQIELDGIKKEYAAKKNNIGKLNGNTLAFLKNKRAEAKKSRTKHNEKLNSWAEDYNKKYSSSVTKKETVITKDQLIPQEDFDASNEKERIRVSDKIRNSKLDPAVKLKALNQAKEKSAKDSANYATLLGLLAAQRTRVLDQAEKMQLERLKNDGKIAAALADQDSDEQKAANVQKTKSETKLNIAKANNE